ncbi:MAG: hypothetical protein RL757_3068 [Bacteroidota bacterium]|jgi:exopolysaccharide biosynthesis protein
MKKIIAISGILVFFSEIMTAQHRDSLAFARANWTYDTLRTGLIWQQNHFQQKEIFESNQHINIIRVVKKNEKNVIRLASAGKNLIKTSIFADSLGALVAINGSFFDTKKGGAVDFIKVNGVIFDSTRFSNGKLAEHQLAAIGIDSLQQALILGGGDSTDIRWETRLEMPNIMVTGPLLLKNEVINPLKNVAFNVNRHPRTAFGITKSEYIFVTIDGRTAQSQGVSLLELTKIMQWLGCFDAVNLDGGGSTTLFIKSKSPNNVVNMPCDNKIFDHEGERAVSNILWIKN